VQCHGGYVTAVVIKGALAPAEDGNIGLMDKNDAPNRCNHLLA